MNSEIPRLYAIDECPDLMVDAYVFDTSFNMLFLSVWGRDTAISAFLARLTLSQDEQGLKQIHITNDAKGTLPVHFGSVERLQKRIARTQRRTLFGALTHLWMYHEQIVKPGKANNTGDTRAILLMPQGSSEQERQMRLWQTVKDNCALPLLDHWQKTVLLILEETQMITPLPQSGIGSLIGYELDMKLEELAVRIGQEIKNDVLLADDAANATVTTTSSRATTLLAA
ncbi:MAG: hypothetical protein ACRCWR_09835 [Saezia sp.]